MMLSQPTTTGIFVLAAAVAFAGGWMQRDAFAWLTTGPDVQQAQEVARPGVPQVPQAERAAAAPARIVSGPGADVTETASTGPIVTVNGRPLDGSSPANAPAVAAVDSNKEISAQTAQGAETVASVEPPKPLPRPEGLSVPSGQAVDYETVTASAGNAAVRSAPDAGFMSYEERLALAPLSGEPQPMPVHQGQDELVAVVGANGEVIWVYEEQTRGATVYPGRPVANPGNPYGFVYDDYDFRW
ncbi:hypothetical protein [Pelagibacterium xiamenense]|uniref:hypothetical protein n=1 Tax=Pelagibacterium xiamenense TaxID=2901140 RepID=UPI001E315AD6|nr:hypothetical protein [Pelagibacterium xiamenense]MCD7060146.1 hypothetical protein [Pelagibacterium xiamenense]